MLGINNKRNKLFAMAYHNEIIIFFERIERNSSTRCTTRIKLRREFNFSEELRRNKLYCATPGENAEGWTRGEFIKRSESFFVEARFNARSGRKISMQFGDVNYQDPDCEYIEITIGVAKPTRRKSCEKFYELHVYVIYF